MADLAALLLRTVTRAFYSTEHVLVIDALIVHSTLQDNDLSHVVSIQHKALRRLCGRLREDGLLSVQARAERRTDGTQSYYSGGKGQPAKERVVHKDWYYLNYHRAIDSIKYRMYRLSKHIESLGMPTTEKKDLVCPRCKCQYTELEVMDKIDFSTGLFLCKRCGHSLDPVEEDERANENESMKRLNSQLEKILRLMQEIDATTVPENDFETALSKQKPVSRPNTHPGQQRTEVVDLPGKNLQSTKGLTIKPEKIAVSVQDDETVKRENEAAEAQARREKEARQNALPDWIVKSTVSGDITAIGAEEERLRLERAQHTALGREEDSKDKKQVKDGDEDVMAAYWEELARSQAEEASRAKSEDEDDDDDDEDDEDEFEDVDVSGAGAAGRTPLPEGVANGARDGTSGMNTPHSNTLESSNATDDEREAKRARTDGPPASTADIGRTKMNGTTEAVAVSAPAVEDTPAASDEDEDDELEFENV